MGVDDCDKSTTAITNLILHTIHGYLSEVVRIESEPSIVTGLHGFFLCPESVLYIEPEDIHRESFAREIRTSLSDHVCRNRSPLAELETKRLDRRQCSEACGLGKRLLDARRTLRRSEHKEFEHATFTDEVNISTLHVPNLFRENLHPGVS